MTERRTGWRKVVAAAALACALSVPASAVYAQAPTPTRPAVGASPAAGEPVQDMTLAAAVLGAIVVGGLTLRRFAARRA